MNDKNEDEIQARNFTFNCTYSYHPTSHQGPKVQQSMNEPHPAPTLFASIMSYFKLAIKV